MTGAHVGLTLTCLLFTQLPHGPGVSDLQCPVHHRAICRICYRDPLLDGEYSTGLINVTSFYVM